MTCKEPRSTLGADARVVSAAALLFVIGCSAPANRPGETTRKVSSRVDGAAVAIDWYMPPIFGQQFDQNGLTRLTPVRPTASDPGSLFQSDSFPPFDGDPFRPDAWNVFLNGCASTPGQSYAWDIALPGGNLHVDSGSSCFTWVKFRAEGTYRVTLTVGFDDGTSAAGDQWVTVKSYLVVSMGDSIASGEGTPVYAEPPIWSDTRCHRSGASGHAQAAFRLEDSDPHTSVRFVSVACSGAGIQKGLLDGYIGEEPPPDTNVPLPRQIDQVAALTCPWVGVPPGQTARPCPSIDALLLTVGANDVSFGEVVRACANPLGDCSTDSNVTGPVNRELQNLPNLYRSLDAAIHQSLSVKRIYFAEYDDPTHDENGALCSQMLFPNAVTDNFGAWGGAIVGTDGVIRKPAVTWAHDHLLVPLNEAALTASQLYGWKYIGGIAASFGKHGYCSLQPWIETYEDSKIDEGRPDGTMHPNDWGYDAIGSFIFSSLAEDTTQPRPVVSSAPQSDGQVRVFGRGAGDTTFVQTWDNSSWSGWQSLGGPQGSEPAAVVPAPGQNAVFVTDTSGHIEGGFWSQATGFSWHPLTDIASYRFFGKTLYVPVHMQGPPTAIARKNGWIDLFARGAEGLLWHLRITSSSASGFESDYWEATNSPPYVGAPSAVADGPHDLDVVVNSNDGVPLGYWRLWHGMESGGTWTWTDLGLGPTLDGLGGKAAGSPSLVSWGPTRLDAFVRSEELELWHIWYDGGGWGPWEALGNLAVGDTVTSDPSVVSWGPGRLDIFARGTDGNVWQMNWDDANGFWSDWQTTFTPARSGIAVDTIGPGMIDWYAVWPGHGLHTELWSVGDGGWSWLAGIVPY